MSDAYKKKQAPKKKARDEFDEEEIFKAPVISREPSSRQAKLGSRVVLRITASGKPIPSFQWFHNGKKISGANTDRLTLTKVRRGAIGAYHCEAKNFVGKAVSRVAMLTFFTQRIAKLVISPEKCRVVEGKPFTLSVTAPSAEELKDLQVHWTFNGMRIKGAHGLSLKISAMKQKYVGDYKAMIATGSGLETSNVAKLEMKPAAAVAKEEQTKTVDEIPAITPAEAPKAKAPAWEDSVFNPDEEADEASLVAPVEGAEQFGNTSPGTPGAPKAPLSQLPTHDLIRAVTEQGGASDLIQQISTEDPSALIEAAEAPPEPHVEREDPSSLIEAAGMSEEPHVEREDPSSLIEAAELTADPAAPEKEDPSGLIYMLENRQKPAVPPPIPAAREEGSGLIQDWGITPASTAKVLPLPPLPRRADPALARKKEFLENFLQRWQNSPKKSPRAA
ncbi:MAG: immunoglobulin domain-containing protein [Bdellovibrionota bacterium]